MLLLGSHVSMSGQDMLLGAARQAASFGASTFMVYTGAPQNTRRKPIDTFKIPEAHEFMAENHLLNIVVHAPYIVNLGNVNKPEQFEFGIQFMQEEVKRAEAIGAATR